MPKCCINELIIPSSAPPGEWKGLVPTQARLLDWEEFIKNCTRALDTEDQQEFIQSYAEEECLPAMPLRGMVLQRLHSCLAAASAD